MVALVTHDELTIRIYDGTAVTPFYVPLTFYDLPEFPGRAPRPQGTTIAGGNKLVNGNIGQVIEDETSTMDPLPGSLTFRLDNDAAWKIEAFGNPLDRASWEVGSGTPDSWTAVLPANIGTRNNKQGNAVNCIAPIHSDELAGMYNIEVEYAVPPGGTGSALYQFLLGCVTKNITTRTIAGGVQFTVDYAVHGQIDWTQTAFTTGTEST